MKVCSVPTCDRRRFGRGWCEAHYRRWQTRGDVQPDVPLKTWVKVDGDRCVVPSCERLRYRGKGSRFCSGHLGRWTKWRDVREDIPLGDPILRARVHPPCLVEGCGGIPRSRHYCSGHAKRIQACGDPLPELPLNGLGEGRMEALVKIIAKARAYDQLMALREGASA